LLVPVSTAAGNVHILPESTPGPAHSLLCIRGRGVQSLIFFTPVFQKLTPDYTNWHFFLGVESKDFARKRSRFCKLICLIYGLQAVVSFH